MRFKLLLFTQVFVLTTVFAQKKEDDFSTRVREQNEIDYESTMYEAFSQKIKGNYNDAIDLYRKCLSLNPNSSASMYELAQIFYLNSDLDACVNLMEKAYALNSKNEWYGVFLLELYKQKKLYDKGIDLCKKIIKNDVYNDLNYYELAYLYMFVGDKSKAENVYKDIEKRFGFSVELYEQKVKFFVYEAEIKKAVKTLEFLIEKYPSEGKYYSDLLSISKQLNDPEKTIAISEQYLKVNPTSESVNLELYNLYYGRKDSVNCYNLLRSILSYKTINVEKKTKLLVSLYSDRKFKVTKELANEFSQIFLLYNPDDYQSHLLRADYYLSSDNEDSAKIELYKVYEKEKSIADVYTKLIDIESKSSNWEHVYKVSRTGIQYFSASAYLYFYAGLSSFQTTRYEEAINYFLSGLPYISSNELRSQLYMYLGESYYKVKDYEKCYHFFDKSISTDQTNSVALNNYSYYLSLSRDSLPKALEMTKISNNLSPKNFVYLDTYAWVLFKMNRYEEALVRIKEAIENGGSKESEIVEHYGDILYKYGNIDEALENWQKAKLLGGTSPHLDLKIMSKTYIE